MWKLCFGAGIWVLEIALQISGYQNLFLGIGLAIVGTFLLVVGGIDWYREHVSDFVTLNIRPEERQADQRPHVTIGIYDSRYILSAGGVAYYRVLADFQYQPDQPNAIRQIHLHHPDEMNCIHYRLADIEVRGDTAGIRGAWNVGNNAHSPAEETLNPRQVLDLPAGRSLLRKTIWILGDSEAPPRSCQIKIVAEDAAGHLSYSDPLIPGGAMIHTCIDDVSAQANGG